MTDSDGQLLETYLDGGLDPAARRALEARLRHEPRLRDELAGVQRTRDLVRAAFAPILDLPLPSLDLQPPPAAGTLPFRRRPAVRAALLGAAAAACLAIGFIGGRLWPVDAPGSTANTFESTLSLALERQVSGTLVQWRDPASGRTGVVVPKRTFKNAAGEFCRSFTASALDRDTTVDAQGIACRDRDGRWHTKLQLGSV